MVEEHLCPEQNPIAAVVRSGALDPLFPATFPSGEGSDLAGVAAERGPGITHFALGDGVIGFPDLSEEPEVRLR